jgi:aldehyde:ferredoxin oxidoreductase
MPTNIGPILWNELTTLYSIITGIEIKKEDLIKTADNISIMIRKFNLREGINKKHDTLPQRFFNEELKTGTSKGEKIQKQEFKKMLNEYYTLKGWKRKKTKIKGNDYRIVEKPNSAKA